MCLVRTPDGQLIAATTGTSSAHYVTDNLGSTVGIVNNSGVKAAAYAYGPHAYDPYGRTHAATGSAAAANALHACGLLDTTTGATKFAARYCDPNTGRFSQPAPSAQDLGSVFLGGGRESVGAIIGSAKGFDK